MTVHRHTRSPLACLALGGALACALAAVLGGCDGGASDALDDVAAWRFAVKKVCGTSGKTLKGVDVSKWQASINWVKVAGDGVVFGIARASHGLDFDDAYFSANWKGMKANGIVRGVYQFCAPKQDPIKQADFMLQKLADAGGLEAGDLPPVLDLELTDGVSPSALQAGALAWLKHVEARTGKTPMIYTASYFAESNLQGALKGYPLWIANYTTPPSQGGCPLLPNGSWTRWDFWQYTSTGAVAGISGNVDVNVFDGDRAALNAFIATHTKGAQPTGRAPRGTLERAGCDVVSGWAFDDDTPDQPVTLEVTVDVAPDQPGATPVRVIADVKRSDLCAAIGSCDHGFSWIIPRAYRDGADHALYVRAIDTSDNSKHALAGAPQTFSCATSDGGSTADGGANGGDAQSGRDGAVVGADGGDETRGGCSTAPRSPSPVPGVAFVLLVALLSSSFRRRVRA